MASVDIIEASGKAYLLVWRERAYLWKLAMVPILIKLVCEVTVLSLGLGGDFIKTGLISLPSYLAEGWMLSHFVRLIFLDHRWPFRPSGDMDSDMKKLHERARGVMGGMVVYALIKVLMIGFVAFSYDAMGGIEQMESNSDKEPSAIMFLLSIVMLSGFIWLFRFFWLYIPVALNFSIREYTRRLGGYNASLWLVGTWLICFIPIFFVFSIVASIVFIDLSPTASAMSQFMFCVSRVLVDTLLMLVITAGISHALSGMIGKQAKPTPKK